MFKKILVITALVAVIGVLVFGAINRTLAKTDNEAANSGQGGYGSGNSEAGIGIPAAQTEATNAQGKGKGAPGRAQEAESEYSSEWANLPPATAGGLSPDESAALLYMREEEKLAHDVYVTFYAKWSLPLFQNISQSEQAHTDAVKTLLDRYGLTDPASSEVGVFANADLQALYNELIARGNQSLAEALKVGAAIEEIDILDLQSRLAQTDNADIQQVFTNLERGSNNHLRAFVTNLSNQTGETYQPQYLSAEAYQASIGSGGRAGGYGNGGSNQQGGGGGGGGRRGGRP